MYSLLVLVPFVISAAFGEGDKTCTDSNTKERANGESWVESNWIKYTCQNGVAKIVACVGQDGATKFEVPVGERKTVNGRWHECSSKDNRIHFFAEPRCKYGNKEYKLGDSFIIGYFRKECYQKDDNIITTKTTACVIDKNEIPLGESKLIGPIKYSCKEEEDGRTRIIPERVKCQSGGEIFDVGATKVFSESYKKTCKEGGFFETTACIITTREGKVEILINKDKLIGPVRYSCTKTERGTQISYKQEKCEYKNKLYDVGSIETHGRFEIKCVEGEYGAYFNIFGCKLENGRSVAKGEHWKEEKGDGYSILHRCYESGNSIAYNQVHCGGNTGTKCDPLPWL